MVHEHLDLISVLVPSRLRPNPLRESISSLRDSADRPDRVEYLVAADPDDAATRITAETLGVPCWTAPERYGYRGLHRYFNQLASLSGGQWLLLWNDDARMATGGWDRAIRALPPEVLVADPWVPGHSPDLCTFPAVRRRAVEAAGGFSPFTCHCDTWWQDIGRALGAIRPVPVRIDHQRADLTGGHNDLTYREGQAGYRSEEFYGQEIQGHLLDTIEKVRTAL